MRRSCRSSGEGGIRGGCGGLGRTWESPTSTSPSPSTAPAGTPPPGASPTPGPRELFTAGYWVDLVAEAERGLLDFVTIEDAFGLQSATGSSGPTTAPTGSAAGSTRC